MLVNIFLPSAGSPLVKKHVYMVERLNFQTVMNSGIPVQVPVSLVLRNPWGTDGAGNDGLNDGLVTITGQQLVASMYGGASGIQSAWLS